LGLLLETISFTFGYWNFRSIELSFLQSMLLKRIQNGVNVRFWSLLALCSQFLIKLLTIGTFILFSFLNLLFL